MNLLILLDMLAGEYDWRTNMRTGGIVAPDFQPLRYEMVAEVEGPNEGEEAESRSLVECKSPSK
jgi:hypothetical protein